MWGHCFSSGRTETMMKAAETLSWGSSTLKNVRFTIKYIFKPFIKSHKPFPFGFCFDDFGLFMKLGVLGLLPPPPLPLGPNLLPGYRPPLEEDEVADGGLTKSPGQGPPDEEPDFSARVFFKKIWELIRSMVISPVSGSIMSKHSFLFGSLRWPLEKKRIFLPAPWRLA